MTARRAAVVMTAALAVYLGLVGLRGLTLLRSSEPVAVLLGAAVLVLPLLGAGLVLREVRFGLHTTRLGRLLEQAGGLPEDDLPRRPSGRIVREAADARAAQRIAEVEAAPSQWQRWFRLSVAYDDAGDRRRARSAMRRAIDLERDGS